MTIALRVAVWVVCGVFAYGLTLNYFTNQFPYMKHHIAASVVALFGPIGMIIMTLFSCSRGVSPWFRFRHLSVEERWEIFHKELSTFDRSYFDRTHA